MDTMDTPEAPQTALAAPTSSRPVWLASRLLDRQVVNTSTLEPVGRVSDVVFDPHSRQVTTLIVRTTEASGGLLAAVRRIGRAFGQHGTIGAIALDHVIALDGDVVMVDGDPVSVTSAPPHAPTHAADRQVCWLCEVCELTIVTLHGMCLGVLADLLLDERGTRVTGYVVTPTRYGESVLPPLEEFVHAESPQTAHGAITPAVSAMTAPTGTTAESAPPDAPDAQNVHVSVIPASPRVRIGDSLILVVEEVEPLRQEAVIITNQLPKEHQGRSNGAHWRWATRRTRR